MQTYKPMEVVQTATDLSESLEYMLVTLQGWGALGVGSGGFFPGGGGGGGGGLLGGVGVVGGRR